MTVTMGLRWRAGDDSPYRARKAPAGAKPCLRPAQVLVHDSRRPAGGDASVFRPAGWRRQPHRKTCAPAPVPNSTAWRQPPGDPNARWAARSRAAPASAPPAGTTEPPDGEDFTLHPAALIIGHVADRRGSAQQEWHGEEEKEEPRWGAGEAVRVAVAQGWGGVAMGPPPLSLLRCGDSCGGGEGVTSETADDKQATIKS